MQNAKSGENVLCLGGHRIRSERGESAPTVTHLPRRRTRRSAAPPGMCGELNHLAVCMTLFGTAHSHTTPPPFVHPTLSLLRIIPHSPSSSLFIETHPRLTKAESWIPTPPLIDSGPPPTETGNRSRSHSRHHPLHLSLVTTTALHSTPNCRPRRGQALERFK